MAAMSLRAPSNGAQIVKEGGITAVLEAMRRHPKVQPLQRQVGWPDSNRQARFDITANSLSVSCDGLLPHTGLLADMIRCRNLELNGRLTSVDLHRMVVLFIEN